MPASRLAQLALGLVFLCVATSCGGKQQGGGTRTTKHLEQTFPVLESYHVIAFRHDEWCQALEYKRGRYASSSGKSCISILSGSRRPYDQTARRDHAAILAAIRGAHDGVRLLKGLQFDREGRIKFGIFDCSTSDRQQIFVFSMDPLDPKTKIDGHTFRPVSASWYLAK